MNYFSSSEPQSHVHCLFIAFPCPRPPPPPPTWRPEGALGSCLTSNTDSLGQQLACIHCRVWTVGKPGSTPQGLLAVKQLQFFYCKEKKKESKQTRRLWLCCWTQILTPLASFPSCAPACHPCPSVLEKRLVLLRTHKGRRPQGMPSEGGRPEMQGLASWVGLLWNG